MITPDPTDIATAYAEMCEAVEVGDLQSAISLGKEFGIPLDMVWAPEDDFLEPRPPERRAART